MEGGPQDRPSAVGCSVCPCREFFIVVSSIGFRPTDFRSVAATFIRKPFALARFSLFHFFPDRFRSVVDAENISALIASTSTSTSSSLAPSPSSSSIVQVQRLWTIYYVGNNLSCYGLQSNFILRSTLYSFQSGMIVERGLIDSTEASKR